MSVSRAAPCRAFGRCPLPNSLWVHRLHETGSSRQGLAASELRPAPERSPPSSGADKALVVGLLPLRSSKGCTAPTAAQRLHKDGKDCRQLRATFETVGANLTPDAVTTGRSGTTDTLGQTDLHGTIGTSPDSCWDVIVTMHILRVMCAVSKCMARMGARAAEARKNPHGRHRPSDRSRWNKPPNPALLSSITPAARGRVFRRPLATEQLSRKMHRDHR